MREEYQAYWVNREDEETEGDQEGPWTRSLRFRLADGSVVLVTIDEAEAELSFGNGAVRRVPLGDLRYCPTCLTEGLYPFYEADEKCPSHDALLMFNLSDFETFEMVTLLRSSKDF
ncbi:MAG: hypothetical protein ACE5HJ_05615 [Thermoplasmata archaeon]